MSKSDKTETNQKITLLKNINKRLETIKKENIEKQLSHDWLTQLVENQLKQKQAYYNFGENYKNKQAKNKFKNVTVRKRELLPLTSEYRLKELLIYSKIPVDRNKKIESAKEIFSNIINIIKTIPPETCKKFKIDYDQSNNVNISEINYESDDDEFTD